MYILKLIKKKPPNQIEGFSNLNNFFTDIIIYNYLGITTVLITCITPLLPITSVATISL